MRKRVLVAAVAVVLAAATVTGCGGGDSTSDGSAGSYCGDLSAAKDSFIGLSTNEITQQKFDDLVDTLHTIRDEAPGDVKDEWTTFAAAVDSFHSALAKTGMTMDDLAKMQNGDSMQGMDMDSVMSAAKSLNSSAMINAQGVISTEAMKKCNVDLTPGG